MPELRELLLGFAFASASGSIGMTLATGIGGVVLVSYLQARYFAADKHPS